MDIGKEGIPILFYKHKHIIAYIPGLISGIYILQFCTYKTVHHCRNTNCLGAIVYYSGSKLKHLNNFMRVAVVSIWDRAIASGRQYALSNISVSNNGNS